MYLLLHSQLHHGQNSFWMSNFQDEFTFDLQQGQLLLHQGSDMTQEKYPLTESNGYDLTMDIFLI